MLACDFQRGINFLPKKCHREGNERDVCSFSFLLMLVFPVMRVNKLFRVYACLAAVGGGPGRSLVNWLRRK